MMWGSHYPFKPHVQYAFHTYYVTFRGCQGSGDTIQEAWFDCMECLKKNQQTRAAGIMQRNWRVVL